MGRGTGKFAVAAAGVGRRRPMRRRQLPNLMGEGTENSRTVTPSGCFFCPRAETAAPLFAGSGNARSFFLARMRPNCPQMRTPSPAAGPPDGDRRLPRMASSVPAADHVALSWPPDLPLPRFFKPRFSKPGISPLQRPFSTQKGTFPAFGKAPFHDPIFHLGTPVSGSVQLPSPG